MYTFSYPVYNYKTMVIYICYNLRLVAAEALFSYFHNIAVSMICAFVGSMWHIASWFLKGTIRVLFVEGKHHIINVILLKAVTYVVTFMLHLLSKMANFCCLFAILLMNSIYPEILWTWRGKSCSRCTPATIYGYILSWVCFTFMFFFDNSCHFWFFFYLFIRHDNMCFPCHMNGFDTVCFGWRR